MTKSRSASDKIALSAITAAAINDKPGAYCYRKDFKLNHY